MACCGHCRDAGDLFTDRTARRDLKKYRRRGPDKSTRLLIGAIKKMGVVDKTLIDVGGGIGAIPLQLFKSGLRKSVNIDASHPYQIAAKEEAAKQGIADKSQFYYGDFTNLAPELEPADILTLDKVICCYPNMERLLHHSLQKTTKTIGIVIPRENVITKSAFTLGNLWFSLRGSEFRTYLHPFSQMKAIIHSKGFHKKMEKTTFLWRVVVFQK